ncbi:MAG: dephospho-CoA kinase [Chloroflexi bacterium]|nr:dephospho-CoA kinase [Chloroflexota bacterium]
MPAHVDQQRAHPKPRHSRRPAIHFRAEGRWCRDFASLTDCEPSPRCQCWQPTSTSIHSREPRLRRLSTGRTSAAWQTLQPSLSSWSLVAAEGEPGPRTVSGRTRPRFIGLTGNIACGKSTVGRLLAARGAEYIDADRLTHQLLAAGTPENDGIVARFGSEVRAADGAIDRPRLGSIVFSDSAALKELEAILHPGVRALIRRAMAAATAPIVVVDAIKLFESGLARELDTAWVVTCPRAEQVRRLTADRGLTPEQATMRIDAQGSQEEKVRLANVVIDNGGTLAETERQVDAALATLLGTSHAAP